MLNLPSWEKYVSPSNSRIHILVSIYNEGPSLWCFFVSLNLTANFFSTKYMKLSAGCPKLPKQMKTSICSMDDLPCYVEGPIIHENDEEHEEENRNEEFGVLHRTNSGDHIEQLEKHKPTSSESSLTPSSCDEDPLFIDHSNNEASSNNLLLQQENNVIDLSTPLSCSIRSFSRGASVCPQIIDLTDSPITIHL